MMKISHRSILIAAGSLFLIFLFSIFDVLAEDAPSPKKTLSRDELRECMKQEAIVKDLMAQNENKRLALESEVTKMTQEAELIAQSLEALSKDNTAAAIKKHNELVDNHNRWAEDHRKRIDAFNASVNEFNLSNAKLLRACATRPFLLEDEKAVKEELAAEKAKK